MLPSEVCSPGADHTPQVIWAAISTSAQPQVRGGDERLDRVAGLRSEEHTSELQSQSNLVCRLLLEKKKMKTTFSMPSLTTRRTTLTNCCRLLSKRTTS